MKSIAVFNNKGGVGKTTLTCNLASYLSLKKKKKVAIIDLDPQCNSTTYLFTEDDFYKIYGNNGNTVSKIFDPLLKAKGYYDKNLPIYPIQKFKVDLIPGDTKLSILEDFLSEDWIKTLSGQARGIQSTLVFFHLLSRLHKYDYVFFDLGPSLGAINRATLIASNFFIMPMTSDIFSLQAVENISVSLENWKTGINKGLETYKKDFNEDFTISDSLKYKWDLKFLGYLTQQYIARTEEGKKRAVKAYDALISKMPEIINEKITKKINPSKGCFKPQIGEIPNLHSLVPLSQASHSPIFTLSSSEGVFGAHVYKVQEFSELLKVIANNVFENIQCLS